MKLTFCDKCGAEIKPHAHRFEFCDNAYGDDAKSYDICETCAEEFLTSPDTRNNKTHEQPQIKPHEHLFTVQDLATIFKAPTSTVSTYLTKMGCKHTYVDNSKARHYPLSLNVLRNLKERIDKRVTINRPKHTKTKKGE